MNTNIITNVQPASFLRLLQLVSPALPIGAFAYSQGLEAAVERGWIGDAATTQAWIAGLLRNCVGTLDVPVFCRLYQAFACADDAGIAAWNAFILASRGAAELAAEDKNLGAALMKVLLTLAPQTPPHALLPSTAYVTAFAKACVQFEIPRDTAALAFVFAWVENQVSAAVRLVPLGQSEGQRILLNLTPIVQESVTLGLVFDDDDITSTAPCHAIASAFHETQYSRLFRS